MIIAGGKVGYVYALNARTGALLWKTPVGEHNGHDDDSVLALSHRLTIKLPYTMLPRSLGGILSNMAAADGSVYVATLDVPIIATNLNTVDGNKGGGQAAGESGHRWSASGLRDRTWAGRARPGSNDPGPGQDSPGDQLNVAANMPGS